MSATVQNFLNRLDAVKPAGKGWIARCPAHEDHTPSLKIDEGDDGRVLLKCWAGCSTEDVVTALGLTMADLFPPKPVNMHVAKPKEAKRAPRPTYIYEDAGGKPVFGVIRTPDKQFLQARPDGRGGWMYGLAGVEPILYRLPELVRAVEDGLLVFIPEGEKDVNNLVALGFAATTSPMGAGKWHDGYSEWLRGATVAILRDNDEPGRKHGEQVARSLYGKAASVKVLDFLGLSEKGDVSDWLQAGGTKDGLLRLVADAPEWGAEAAGKPVATVAVPPSIWAGNQDLAEVTGQAWDAVRILNQREPSIFRRGGSAVRVEHDDKGSMLIIPLGQDRMRHELARCADWFGLKAEGKGDAKVVTRVPAKPPNDVVRDVLATPNYPLPVLERLTEVPVLAPDGTVSLEQGYQPAARVYFQPAKGLRVPRVPGKPTGDDIARALSFLTDDLLIDFPFKEAADRANAVALFLLPFARSLIAGPTPLHLIEGPTPGTGKGLLAESLLRPALGQALAFGTQVDTEDEWRKRLTAAFREGQPAFFLDNLTRPLDSGVLSGAITAPVWGDRILGETANLTLPVNCVFGATANNPILSTEIARRTVRIRLDAKVEKPWERTGFKYANLAQWRDEHRGDLVWAALTIIRGWIVAGRPAGANPSLGSFESWAATIGGILAFAGVPDFLGNLASLYDAADAEMSRWRGFVESWWEQFADSETAVKDLYPLAVDCDFPLGKGDERAQRTSLGMQLNRMRERVFEDLQIVEGGRSHKAKLWRLIPTEGGASNDPF